MVASREAFVWYLTGDTCGQVAERSQQLDRVVNETSLVPVSLGGLVFG